MAEAAANAALQRQQQLRNEANKLAMKIPFFSGVKKDDSLQIKEFIKRFESATASMNLVDDAEKCKMFANYLRGPATMMFENMKALGDDVEDWDFVKDTFLEHYHGKATEQEFACQITKLTQKKDEPVGAFGHRCINAFLEHVTLEFPAVDRLPADANALAAASKAKLLKELKVDVVRQLARTFFITGVKDNIKVNLQNKNPKTMTEAMKEASLLEIVQEEKVEFKSKIAALAELEDDELAEEGLEEQTISAINNWRARNGKQPFKPINRNGNGFRQNGGHGNGHGNGYGNGNGNGNGNGQANGNNFNKCRYCKKPGHMQLQCKFRIAKGAPCVDSKGNKLRYQPKVNGVEVDDEAQPGNVEHMGSSLKTGPIESSPITLNF